MDRLAAGLYAWVVTVALPAAAPAAPLSARLLALTAVVALAAGAVLSSAAPLLSRLMGVWLFVGACVATWSQNVTPISAARLDPVQGALGSIGWGLFALSWAGEQRGASAERAPVGPAELPRRILIVATASLAVAPMVAAWWVPGVERALFAHGVSLAGAIAVLGTATTLVVSAAGERGFALPAARIGSAFAILLALSALLLAGALLRLLR